MKCQQKDNHGVCGVVKALCGIGIKPMEPFCRVCTNTTDTPKSGKPNNVTVTLAYGTLKKHRPKEAAAFAEEWKDVLKNVTNKTVIPQGPGTELALMLNKLGIKECTTCHIHARTMNKHGCDWCEENEETILQWLREGAERNSVPFVKTVAKWFLRKAIKRARMKQKDGSA